MPPPDFSKLLAHPDCEEIISKLATGYPAKEISDWLKLKYDKADQGHLRLSSSILSQFSETNLDLYNTMRTDLEKVKTGTIDKKLASSLKNNKTYQEQLALAAGKEVNIMQTMVDTIHIVKARLEQIYDKVQQNPENTKPDYVLIKYIELLNQTAEKYDRIVNNAPDQIIQHNITIQTIEQHTAVLQNAVWEVLSEMDQDIAFMFMEKLNSKLAVLKGPEQEVLAQDKRLKEAELIGIVAEKIEEGNKE